PCLHLLFRSGPVSLHGTASHALCPAANRSDWTLPHDKSCASACDSAPAGIALPVHRTRPSGIQPLVADPPPSNGTPIPKPLPLLSAGPRTHVANASVHGT